MVVAYFKVLSGHLPGKTKETQKAVSQSRSELDTSLKQVYNVTDILTRQYIAIQKFIAFSLIIIAMSLIVS
jgi:hypothetical protein